jgi:hypothetical protein
MIPKFGSPSGCFSGVDVAVRNGRCPIFGFVSLSGYDPYLATFSENKKDCLALRG